MIGSSDLQQHRDGLRWPRSPRDVAVNGLVILGLGAVVAVSGPFGTFYDLDFVARLGYWLGSFLVGWLIIVVSIVMLLPRLVRTGLSPPGAGTILGAMGALPLSAVVLGFENLFRPNVDLPSFFLLYLYVALVAVPLTAGMIWARWHSSLRLALPPQPEPDLPPPPFLERIPARLGRDLLVLESEDHYVRIHTALGSDLVLMRLGDAVEALRGVDGLRVHRSYWVARAAVVRADRVGRRLTLTLKNGVEVPVSRTYAAALREHGWLLD